MNRHSDVRLLLYDYLDGKLPEKDRVSVEEHLQSCAACTEDLHRLQEALSLVARPERPAGDARSEEFWATFSASVEGKIRHKEQTRTRLADLRDSVHSFLFFRRGSFAVAGMAVAVILLVIVLVNRPAPTHEYVFVDSSSNKSVPLEPHMGTAQKIDDGERDSSEGSSHPHYATQPLDAPIRVRYADNRMSQYLRKSKVLLIGITNLKPNEGQSLDLRVEQRASRELIREARYLKQRTLSPRVDDLVESMSRILIELANISNDKQSPNVEIVRSGIHQENLLFKIRMAETAFDSAQVIYAKGIQQ